MCFGRNLYFSWKFQLRFARHRQAPKRYQKRHRKFVIKTKVLKIRQTWFLKETESRPKFFALRGLNSFSIGLKKRWRKISKKTSDLTKFSMTISDNFLDKFYSVLTKILDKIDSDKNCATEFWKKLSFIEKINKKLLENWKYL